eukprot:gene7406-11729_t
MLLSIVTYIAHSMNQNINKPKIAYFISDHGFGHGTRSLLIIKKLLPHAKIMVISKVPTFLFENLPVQVLNSKVDVGVVQKSSVEIDFNSTLKSLELYWNNYQKSVEKYSQILSQWGVTKIISDTTVLGISVAKALDVTAIGISNFSWHWWYKHYVKEIPDFQKYINFLEKEYKKTDLFIRYPYTEDMRVYDNVKKININWVADVSKMNKKDTRDLLKLQFKKLMLYTFGGHSFNFDQCHLWKIPKDWTLIIFKNQYSKMMDCKNERIRFIKFSDLKIKGLKMIDLMAASDVVVSKLGFGTVSEIIMNKISCLYLPSRKGFVEQLELKRGIDENVSSDMVTVKDVETASESLFEKANAIVPNKKERIHGLNGGNDILKLIL